MVDHTQVKCALSSERLFCSAHAHALVNDGIVRVRCTFDRPTELAEEQAAHQMSGCDAVTVAVRRERLVNAEGRSLLEDLDLDRLTVLPNTAGCFTAEDAVRVARRGRVVSYLVVLRGFELALHCLAAMAWRRRRRQNPDAIARGSWTPVFEFLSYGSGCEGLRRSPGSLISQI